MNTPKPNKTAKAKVSTKAGKSTVARPERLKNKQMAEKEVKQPKRPVGRPTSYKPEYSSQAYRLCLLGSTDKEMAGFFGVSEQTLNAWKSEFPEFLESTVEGKVVADAKVAESLYKRATGYTAKKVITANVAGVISDVKEVNDYVGPDTSAASLWLRNRQPAKWRDKIDHELTGKGGGPIELLMDQITTNPNSRIQVSK